MGLQAAKAARTSVSTSVPKEQVKLAPVPPPVETELKYIPIKQLRVHPSIQRTFRQYIADRIAKQFDPAKLGELRVAWIDGAYYVFDGQHRLAGCRTYLQDDNQTLPCMVYKNTTQARLASICRGLNSSVAWRALDEFNLRVEEKERQACEIFAVLKEFGLRLDPCRSHGTVQAVKALDWVYQYTGGAQSVKGALSISIGAFQKAPDGFDGTIIKGVGLFLMLYPKANRASLVKKIKNNGGPSKLIGQARDRSKLEGVSVARAMALTLLTSYNKGLKTKDRLARPAF
jgi:hypothetical protein